MYANSYLLYLHKLETLNNKLLRILQNKPHSSPSNDLYIDQNTLSIPDLHIRQILLFVHKFTCHKHRLPGIFSNYFRLTNSVHDMIHLEVMIYMSLLSNLSPILMSRNLEHNLFQSGLC